MGIHTEFGRPDRGGGSEAGFAIPIAIGVGLIMLLLGVTMIVRSQNDQVNASAQKATSKSLAAAETGVSKIQTFLNRYRTLATYPDLDAGGGPPSWESRSDIMCPNDVTSSETERNTLYPSSGDWTDIDTNDPTNGEFKIVDYAYGTGPADYGVPGQNGSLTVQGRVNAGGPGESTSQVLVTIPIRTAEQPALWVQSSITGGPTTSGSIVGPCSLTPSANVLRKPAPINVIPPIPNQDPSSVALPGPYVVLGQGAPDEKYFTSTDLNQSLQFWTGSQVQIWVNGNINLAGQTIQCVKADGPDADAFPDPCDANDSGKLIIYGLPSSPPTTRQILLDNGSVLCHAVFHAPVYDVNFDNTNGSTTENCGTSNVQLSGAFWVNSWAGDTGSITLEHKENIVTYPPELIPPQITPVTQWQTEEVN